MGEFSNKEIAAKVAAQVAAQTAQLAAETASETAQTAAQVAVQTAAQVAAHERITSISANKEVMVEAVGEVLDRIFGTGVDDQKFINASRIPLICQDVRKIHEDIKEIKEEVMTRNGDHETRLRGIEKNIWKWAGVSMIIPPIVTITIAWIIHLIIDK